MCPQDLLSLYKKHNDHYYTGNPTFYYKIYFNSSEEYKCCDLIAPRLGVFSKFLLIDANNRSLKKRSMLWQQHFDIFCKMYDMESPKFTYLSKSIVHVSLPLVWTEIKFKRMFFLKYLRMIYLASKVETFEETIERFSQERIYWNTPDAHIVNRYKDTVLFVLKNFIKVCKIRDNSYDFLTMYTLSKIKNC